MPFSWRSPVPPAPRPASAVVPGSAVVPAGPVGWPATLRWSRVSATLIPARAQPSLASPGRPARCEGEGAVRRAVPEVSRRRSDRARALRDALRCAALARLAYSAGSTRRVALRRGEDAPRGAGPDRDARGSCLARPGPDWVPQVTPLSSSLGTAGSAPEVRRRVLRERAAGQAPRTRRLPPAPWRARVARLAGRRREACRLTCPPRDGCTGCPAVLGAAPAPAPERAPGLPAPAVGPGPWAPDPAGGDRMLKLRRRCACLETRPGLRVALLAAGGTDGAWRRRRAAELSRRRLSALAWLALSRSGGQR